MASDMLHTMWDNLTELSQKNPAKYEEIIGQSAREYAKVNSVPLPHTCFHIKDKKTSGLYAINVFGWDRLPEEKGDALPMAGGFPSTHFGQPTFSLAINTKVLTQIMVKGGKAEKQNLVDITVDFLANRTENRVSLDKASWSMARGTEYVGNLAQIQHQFAAANLTQNKEKKNLLLTQTPNSLINKLSNLSGTKNNSNEEEEHNTSKNKKKYVQEISKKKEKQNSSTFENNLQKAFTMTNGDKTETETSVKIRPDVGGETKMLLSQVSTKKVVTKKPLFGRSVCLGQGQPVQVKLKFLLPHEFHQQDIYFYVDQLNFGLQTKSGYLVSQEPVVLLELDPKPVNPPSWTITNRHLAHPVYTVVLERH